LFNGMTTACGDVPRAENIYCALFNDEPHLLYSKQTLSSLREIIYHEQLLTRGKQTPMSFARQQQKQRVHVTQGIPAVKWHGKAAAKCRRTSKKQRIVR